MHKAKRPYRRHSAKVDDAESSPVCDEQETIETFTCEECGVLFTSELDLKKHGSIHKAKRPYKRHSVKVEVAESSLVCGECGKSFTDAKIFQKHSLSHKKHPCTDCSKSFATITGLQKHKNGKCKSTASAAEKVEGAVKSEKGAEENEAEDKKHVCGICGKSFSRKSSLEGHVIVHLTEEENESEIDDEFKDHDYVQGVQEKEKIDPEPPRLPKLKIRTKFRCNNCEEVFTTDEDLKKHDEQTHKSKVGIKVEEDHLIVKVKQEPEEKKYDCSFCSESFLSRKKLEGHYVDAHDAKNVKRKYTPSRRPAEKDATFLCQICDKVFGRKSRLKKHLLFHENKLEEDVSSDGMESNRKRKSKAKNYPCETCGRRFAGRICLEKHMLKHSESKNEDAPSSSNGETPTPKRRKNVKELICEFCKEDFTGRKNAFIKHRNLHTPEVCGICDERFVDRQALREHCKSHIGTEEARVFLECSQKAFNAKNGIVPPEPKVEYIYLVLR
ncbi:zinc finger protein 585B-like [Uloborus diversus]|uniref:zinc finger protein 585B-like n=1 Tax=Uloborus diversus TaxID=327109 RepID=UPI00240A953C|nr:zinc finger protein 585B-like [Uloborus diversus]